MELKKGKIVTFYSFKGGTGRSMALANIGVLLAKSGFKTLMIDWDLEAPGLHEYFYNKLQDPDKEGGTRKGLVELLIEIQRKVRAAEKKLNAEECKALMGEINLSEYIVSTAINGLSLLMAGETGDGYIRKVSRIAWEDLFKRAEDIFFHFADALAEQYDYILIDSRTGYTDSSGICTMILPEKLVLVFTPNSQSLDGVITLAEEAVRYRRSSGDIRPLVLLPLPSRIEIGEKELREKWRNERLGRVGYQPAFEELLETVYAMESVSLTHYFDDVQIQHEPKYAYGEEIAVLDEPTRDRLSLTESYNRFLNHLVDDQPIWDRQDQFRLKIYLSYVSEDKDLALRLSRALRDMKYMVWTDEDLLAGDNYLASIQKALMESDLIIPIVSDQYARSKSAAFELSFFKEQKRFNGNKKILLLQLSRTMPKLPVNLGECEVVKSKDRSSHEMADEIDFGLKAVRVAKQNFMIEKLSLSSSQHGALKLKVSPPKEGCPALFCGDDDDVLSLESSGPFGSLLFHEITNENFSIRHNEYRVEEDIDLSTEISMQSLGLLYTLKNNMRFVIKGFPEGLILKHQFNMVYVPKVDWKYMFRKSEEYACFGIHFTTEYLQHCSETFPLLPEFLENIETRTPAFISPHHPSATPEMMAVIQNILSCNYTGTMKKMYLESKVPELLLLSLQHVADDNAAMKVSLKESDLRKLRNAKEYIIRQMDNPGTIKQLAHEVGINDFKLHKGFKQMYGTTVFGLLLDERMKKAKMLLQDTSFSIQEIATQTGYKNLSNFTAAFKRKFGYPPSVLKHGLSPGVEDPDAFDEEQNAAKTAVNDN